MGYSIAMRLLALIVLAAGVMAAQVVQDVRKAAQAGDFATAQARLQQARGFGPWTAELILAHSWLGRGAQANQKWEQALTYAAETRRMALEMLKTRALDAEPNLPLALSASIEVQGQALAGSGRRSEGVSFLKDELARWKESSMRMRIQKNLHLLSLVGQKAPRLENGSLEANGKPVLLFLWAHWCVDCKAQGPIIEALRKEFPSLQVVAPTQRYGYVAGGEEAPKDVETRYIAAVQKQYYPWLNGVSIPVSEENFRVYGVSSTPTLVLVDGKGIVRMYHPGGMKAEELRQAVSAVAK